MLSPENHNDLLQTLADWVAAETRRCLVLQTDGKTVTTDGLVHKFSLPEYKEAMQVMATEQVLSEKFLQSRIEYFLREVYKFKQKFPRGSRLIVGILPCNANGTLYSDAELSEGKHLNLFLVDPNTNMGIYGDTLAALLPQEIEEKCSFIIDYDHGDNLLSEAEFQRFHHSLGQAFANLRDLLFR